jgi:CheY-like chemotaxis protein
MPKKSIKTILLVEDNPGDARLLREMLNEQGLHRIEMTHVERWGDAAKRLTEQPADVILLDLGLPHSSGGVH